jgi:hypothetical protein
LIHDCLAHPRDKLVRRQHAGAAWRASFAGG